MTEEDLLKEAKHLTRWQQHKFMVLVGMTIVTSLLLVVVSLYLYRSSGAEQLDLSRPGYEAVREQASQNDLNDFTSFPSTGPLDKDAIGTFRSLYDEQLKQATALNSFGGEVMSDSALSIDAPQNVAE
jgi:hypothetical protein